MNDLHEPIKHKNKLARLIAARPELMVCVALAIGLAIILPESVAYRQSTRAIIAGNVGAVLYMLLAARVMFSATHESMRRLALRHDEGRLIVLTLVVVCALVSLGAIVLELHGAKSLEGRSRLLHIVLAVLTLAASWAFTQLMFALHYAHDFYVAQQNGKDGGLVFPGTPEPDYFDFLYFSIIIGTSAQTADVNFTSRLMRRTGTVHCALAFFFNTSLIALTINIVSGLF